MIDAVTPDMVCSSRTTSAHGDKVVYSFVSWLISFGRLSLEVARGIEGWHAPS